MNQQQEGIVGAPLDLYVIMRDQAKSSRDPAETIPKWVNSIEEYCAKQKHLKKAQESARKAMSRRERARKEKEAATFPRKKGHVSGSSSSGSSSSEDTNDSDLSWSSAKKPKATADLAEDSDDDGRDSTGSPRQDEGVIVDPGTGTPINWKEVYDAGGANWLALKKRYPEFLKTAEYKKYVAKSRKKSADAVDKEGRDRSRAALKRAAEAVTAGAPTGMDMSFVKRRKKLTTEEAGDLKLQSALGVIEAKSRIRYTTASKHVIDIFKCDVLKAVQPVANRLKRLPNMSFVSALKQKIKISPYAIVAPLCFVVVGLKDPSKFDMEKFDNGEYRFEALGGNHSRIAFVDLYNGRTRAESENFAYCRTLRYRDAVLFADNMTDEEARLLGEAHNADNDFRSTMTFMDRLREATSAYYEADGETKAFVDDIDWKRSCLSGWGETEDKLKHYSPLFVTARWSPELLQLLNDVDKQYSAGKILVGKEDKAAAADPGMKGKGIKESGRSASGKEKCLNAGYITALNGLADEEIKNLLQQVMNREKTMNQLKADALAKKCEVRIQKAWMECANCRDVETVIRRFGKAAYQQSVANFMTQFSKDRKYKSGSYPTGFEEMVSTKVKEFDRRNAAVQAADAGEDWRNAPGSAEVDLYSEMKSSTGSSTETTYGYRFLLPRVFLGAQEFRGSDDAVDLDTTGLAPESKTNIKIFRGNVTDGSSPLLADQERCVMDGDFKLVLLDPPYGKTQEHWDQGWGKAQFEQAFRTILLHNQSKAFTLVSFCSAEQISPFLEVLKADYPGKTIGSTHGVWSKEQHHALSKYFMG